MTRYETLQEEVRSQAITLREAEDLPRVCRGLYVRYTGRRPMIVLNRRMTAAEKRCVCAEELGHHHTSGGDLTNACPIEYGRQERRARKWSVHHILSLDTLAEAYLRHDDPFELADALDVTVEYLNQAIQYYRDAYGVFLRTDRYLIQFLPCFSVREA